MGNGGLAVIGVGIVAFLLGVVSGIAIALHAYGLGFGALVLSVAGWFLTLRLAARAGGETGAAPGDGRRSPTLTGRAAAIKEPVRTRSRRRDVRRR